MRLGCHCEASLFSSVGPARVDRVVAHNERLATGLRCGRDTGKLFAEVRTSGTMTRDLLALADDLEDLGATHVALESTGVLWKPVWNILEGRFQLLLVNPRHVKQVPGRKSDVSDTEWIAQLLQWGLGFRPTFQFFGLVRGRHGSSCPDSGRRALYFADAPNVAHSAMTWPTDS
jgi:hypothetical protein